MASTKASATTSNLEDNIDTSAPAAFSAPLSSAKHLNTVFDSIFFKSLNLRGYNSKLSAYIESCNVSSEPFSALGVDKPYFFKWEEVESTLKSVLNPKELEIV